MSIAPRIRIVEVGPRDGLQNEKTIVPVDVKVALIEALADAGLTSIEAGSFVSPKWVPQMADSAEVVARLRDRPAVTYTVLTPNLLGFDRAVAFNVKEVAVFASASEGFSQRNINCSIQESLARFAPIMEKARDHDIKVRGYVSCVLGCPYEGQVSSDAVSSVASRLFEMGCYEISLGDTIGAGTPLKARRMVERVSAAVPIDRLALHFHDTYGQALANIFACLDLGITVIDSAVAGLGGCPYAAGASGNVATEDVVYMLEGMGIETDIDLAALAQAGQMISRHLEVVPSSKISRALMARG